MEIRFGRPVVSVDGERAGTVERLALATDCRMVREIVVLHGIDERLIPFRSVSNVDDDGFIDIDMTGFEVQQASLHLDRGGAGQPYVPYTSWVSGETISSSYAPSSQPSNAWQPPAQEDPDRERVEIDAENVVAGPDGKVVGTIAGIEVDETGLITELIIDTGFLRPDMRVDMATVDYVEGSYIAKLR
jgi:sporulation protein YlmC with PRC-barrel domain